MDENRTDRIEPAFGSQRASTHDRSEESPNVFREVETKKKTKKRSIKNWIILILVAALIVTWLGPNIESSNITGYVTGIFAKGQSEMEGLGDDGSYFQGAEDAPVKIILFTEFQCPYSGRFARETLPQLREEYIKTGKVKFILKHLPLDFHNMAETAAWASMCAGKQGIFWEYHDELFNNQDRLSREFFVDLAEEMELDIEDFDICLRDRRVLRQITADEEAAAEVKISGTPAFLINGEKLVGAQPFSAFKEVIDRKLSE